MTKLRHQQSSGTVHIHERRRVSEPGATFVVAVNPTSAPRWESVAYEDRAIAETIAEALAAYMGAEVVR